jgi:hypothetical protein
MASPIRIFASDGPIDVLYHRRKAKSLAIIPNMELIRVVYPRCANFLHAFAIQALYRTGLPSNPVAGFKYND